MHCILLLLLIIVLLISTCACAETVETIDLDGNDQGRVFDGIGGLSAGASSRLLYDYPEPQRSNILDLLFKPNFGASLHILKVEIGGDIYSTWGSEPSHANTREEFEHPKREYFDHGYEWWLMKEAKKRNPDIIFESIQWGAPGWIGNGEFYSQDNADFIARFIKAARDYHGVTINYQGIRNECAYNIPWVKILRKTLDSYGLQDVKLQAADGVPSWGGWGIIGDLNADPEFSKVVHAVSMHYPSYTTPDDARKCGKPLWDEEDAIYGDPWPRADGFAKLYNRNYAQGRMTKTIICTPITCLYDYLSPFNVKAWADPGLMKANTPWSGHYVVPPAIWVTAHTTQFTKPGWRYLDGGCGVFKNDGSYVTLRSPDNSGNYSIIIETMKGGDYANVVGTKESDPLPHIPVRRMKFNLKNLSTGTLHVWRTSKSVHFKQLPDIAPENGSFEITLEGNSIYTLTTTTGQHKGSYEIPKASPFPFPCKDNFEKYAPGKTPKYFSDQDGTFAVAQRGDGQGNCLRQILPQRGIEWNGLIEYPWTAIGDVAWTDYEVSADVHVGEKGFGGVYGRIDDPLSRPMPGGYGLFIDSTGAWQLKDTTTVIESGNIKTTSNSWHNLKLRFKGNHVIGVIDGKTVCRIQDDAHPGGSAALASSYDYVEFDNFTVKPLKGRTPKPIAEWENLALGAKTTASSQSDDSHSAEKSTDRDHASGWCPAAGKTSGEWLEVDFGKEVTFDRTSLDQHKTNQYAAGIIRCRIQYWNGSKWKDLAICKQPAVRQINDFSPVTAGKVRLLITEVVENACVYEFKVHLRKR